MGIEPTFSTAAAFATAAPPRQYVCVFILVLKSYMSKEQSMKFSKIIKTHTHMHEIYLASIAGHIKQLTVSLSIIILS